MPSLSRSRVLITHGGAQTRLHPRCKLFLATYCHYLIARVSPPAVSVFIGASQLHPCCNLFACRWIVCGTDVQDENWRQQSSALRLAHRTTSPAPVTPSASPSSRCCSLRTPSERASEVAASKQASAGSNLLQRRRRRRRAEARQWKQRANERRKTREGVRERGESSEWASGESEREERTARPRRARARTSANDVRAASRLIEIELAGRPADRGRRRKRPACAPTELELARRSKEARKELLPLATLGKEGRKEGRNCSGEGRPGERPRYGCPAAE